MIVFLLRTDLFVIKITILCIIYINIVSQYYTHVFYCIHIIIAY